MCILFVCLFNCLIVAFIGIDVYVCDIMVIYLYLFAIVCSHFRIYLLFNCLFPYLFVFVNLFSAPRCLVTARATSLLGPDWRSEVIDIYMSIYICAYVR